MVVVEDLNGLSNPNDSVLPLKNTALPIHTCVTMSKADVALFLHSSTGLPTLLLSFSKDHKSM